MILSAMNLGCQQFPRLHNESIPKSMLIFLEHLQRLLEDGSDRTSPELYSEILVICLLSIPAKASAY